MVIVTPIRGEGEEGLGPSLHRRDPTYTGGSTSCYAYESLDGSHGASVSPSPLRDNGATSAGANTSILSNISNLFTPSTKAAHNYNKVAGADETNLIAQQRRALGYGATAASSGDAGSGFTPPPIALDMSNVTLDSSLYTASTAAATPPPGAGEFGHVPHLRRTLSEIAFERDYAQETSVNPLFAALDPFRWHIIIVMLVTFSTVISGTIVIDAVTGVTPDS